MDERLNSLIKKEVERQKLTLDLIPSENIAAPELLKILGSPLVNKYSEGYPGRRYYPGNEFYDEIENLARERALKAFKLNPKNWAVNVQPYSGSPANLAIYFALLNTRINADQNADSRGRSIRHSKVSLRQAQAIKGVDIMGLSLAHGGHLTHGHLVNFSGILYKSIPYTLNLDTGYIDYKNLEKLARKHHPKIIVSGATAYPRKIDFKKIGEIAHQAHAYHVADISHIAGLVAAGAHPSPFLYSDVVMATTHKTLRGPRGAVIWANRQSPIAKRNKIDITSSIDKAVFPGLQGGPHNNTTAAIAWAFGEVATPKFRVYARQIVKNAKVLASELRKFGFNLVSGGTDNHLMLVDLRNKNITGLEAEKLLEAGGLIANRNAVPGDDKPFKPSGIRIGTPSVTSRGMREKEMEQIANFIHRMIDLRSPVQKVKRQVEKLARHFSLQY